MYLAMKYLILEVNFLNNLKMYKTQFEIFTSVLLTNLLILQSFILWKKWRNTWKILT